jgi:uncharacterized protein YqfB (UPF0267 family)
VDLEHAYALKARGKATFTVRDNGESSVMKFMRTPRVCEVVLALVSVDTIKLDFMSIRETQQQQNFRF